MTQNSSHGYFVLGLTGSVLATWIIFQLNSFALGQKIESDQTLGKDSSLVTPDAKNINLIRITRGVTQGVNLFHSFSEFNVGDNQSVFFDVSSNVGRVISRVTGGNSSRILGKLGVSGGSADLFLLNPNGIFFGPNSSLDLKGSFLATTASSFVFPSSEFSAIDTPAPKLSVNMPIGLRFRNSGGSIENQSKRGLLLQPGKTLALVGGDIRLDGGVILVNSGKIELGSVTSGKVDLTDQNLTLEYKNITPENFGNINIVRSSTISASGTPRGGETSGSIDLQGKTIKISDGSRLFAVSFSKKQGGNIKIGASDSFELSGEDNTKLKLNSQLTTSGAASESASGDVIIDSKKFFLRDKASIQTSSSFIENTGILEFSNGKAGNVFITTAQTEISGGAAIRANTNGGAGEGGNISIKTDSLQIRDGASVSAISTGKGTAGNIDIFARSILLENQGFITDATTGGKGDITLHVANDITLRNNSRISANATNSADGGNIRIDASLFLALSPTGSEGSDIIATAINGNGGKISINAKGIFGIEQRASKTGNMTNDIDASSQFGSSGQVNINTTTDPNNGLIELPQTVIDPSSLVAQNPCKHTTGSEFVRSGRGGLPPSLSQDFDSNTSRVGLVQPIMHRAEKPESKPVSKGANSLPSSPLNIVPAQGWVYNNKGEVVLVVYNPSTSGTQRSKPAPASCPAF